jgi:hypothetical protein
VADDHVLDALGLADSRIRAVTMTRLGAAGAS